MAALVVVNRLVAIVSLTLFSCCYAGILSRVVPERQPRHVHLSLGENPGEMVVTWSTVNDTKASIVEYGKTAHDFSLQAEGIRSLFVDGGPLKLSQYIHRVTLKDLQPGQAYYYHCGSDYGWSEMFTFTYTRTDPDWSPRFAVFGDMGIENPQSLPRLQKDTQNGLYDAILHVGDMAYDMYEENGRVGDYFMELIEPIAAYLPYMTCVGNHESSYNFSHYRARFSMPGGQENLMYSFNLGPAHFVAISTEFYYFMRFGVKQVAKQYEWLVQDLKEANAPANRSVRPWIITFGHRPMYCSNNDTDDCTKESDMVRTGIPLLHWFGLEKLFYENGVDLTIWAHEHSYERLWPVYNGQVMNGSLEEPYRNPRAPVHVVTGSAGCRELKDGFKTERPPWSAFHTSDYGYARMQVFNKTHLYMEQVSDDRNGAVVDSFWMVKDQHGSYNELFP